MRCSRTRNALGRSAEEKGDVTMMYKHKMTGALLYLPEDVDFLGVGLSASEWEMYP